MTPDECILNFASFLCHCSKMKILKFRMNSKEETEMAKNEFNLDGTNTDKVCQYQICTFYQVLSH